MQWHLVWQYMRKVKFMSCSVVVLEHSSLATLISAEHFSSGFLLPMPPTPQRYRNFLPLLTSHGNRSCGPGHLQDNHRKLFHVWDKSQLYLAGSRRLQAIRLKGHQQFQGQWHWARTEKSHVTCPGNSQPTALGFHALCGPPWQGSGRQRERALSSKAQQKI